MKIVLTCPLEESVPPKKYGGTEQIVYLLSQEYVRLGHEVYLLASGDSQTTAHLVPIIPTSIRSMPKDRSIGVWRDYWKYTGTAKIIQEINNLKPDIIHNNFDWRLIAFESLIHYPMISTMHGPLTNLKDITTYNSHSRHNYISISDNQRKPMPHLNWLGTVYNGIEVNRFPFNKNVSDRDYFIFLGRSSPEKGLAEIVRMIKKTKYKLKIGAKVDEIDREYFTQKIEPYIDGQQIEFLGEIGFQEKTKLLSQAKALLLWLNWEEPFGLVVPEANACGTPVIVNPRGSMTELVMDGKTGFLVDSIDEMQSKLSTVSTLSPADCRGRVDKLYSAERMAQNYLALAEEVINNYRIKM